MPAIRMWPVKALVVGMVLACGGGGGGGGGGGITNPPPGPGPSGNATITMGAATFVPSVVTITRNGTVTWNNTSGIDHNVTFAAAAGAPSNIETHGSGTNQRTFGTVGTFNFSCTLHGGMNGSVTVQ